jgi:uncharacterized protein YbbK (DUF523 family)
MNGARRALNLIQRAGAQSAILKQRSPSCGTRTVHGRGPGGTDQLIAGEGVAAAAFRTAGLDLADEDGA